MDGHRWTRFTLGLSTTALLFASCADKLEGGVFSDDKEQGLGVEDDDASPKSKDDASDKGDSDKEDTEKDPSKDEPSEDDDGEVDSDSDGSKQGSESSSSEDEESGSNGDDDNDSADTEKDDTGDGPSDNPSDDPKEDPKEDPDEDPQEPSGESVSGDVEISFSTRSYGGNYGPRNVGAVWVETKDGTFLRTLKVWAKKRAVHLVEWRKASGSNKTDAITGATLTRPQSHEFKWNRKDAKGEEMGVGDYVMRFELTEDNSSASFPPGPTLEMPFHLGGGTKTLERDDNEAFVKVKLVTPD